jgi:peptidoglycan/xylan/chitin deacetylase (PgdA/CDA1 family)
VLDVYIKGCDPQTSYAYLTENELEMKFSLSLKLYYFLLRPVLPLPLRAFLQRAKARRIEVRPDFIWPELVDLVRGDPTAWRFVESSLYPAGYDACLILTHDVETQRGFDFIPQVLAIENELGFRGSWNLVAHKYKLREEIVALISSSGHEIGIHGYNHDGTLYYSRQRFRWRAQAINAALRRYGAVGFRSPQVHRNLRWLQELEVLYDASCFDYDPYQPFPGGTGCIWPFMAGRFVELPYTLPQDHTLFDALGMNDISVWRRKTEWLLENRGMVHTLTHPDYLMAENRLQLYREFLEYLSSLPRLWHCLPRELAARYVSL